MATGWIGVDFDGTLAVYGAWKGESHTGAPILPMVKRVKRWLSMGIEVRVVTARVGKEDEEAAASRAAIERWCIEHVGQRLRVTATKDYAMLELWDDRAVQVETNTGRILGRRTRKI